MTTALLWGAAGGIGRALLTELQTRGWPVLAVARSGAGLAGSPVIEADLAEAFSIQQAVLSVAQQTSEIGLWLYAAGDIASAPVAEAGPALVHRLITANLTGAMLAAHYSLPLLRPDAHLVLVGAAHERLRLPGLSAYAAAKAGLEAFADVLRKEARGRRVTVVRPGAVDTAFWDKVPFKKPAAALAPAALAARVMEAVAAGHSGTLEL